MKNFYRRLLSSWPLFLIQKQTKAGPYLNSPLVWVDCGLKRFADRAVAEADAPFIVGSSLVRVIPMEDDAS